MSLQRQFQSTNLRKQLLLAITPFLIAVTLLAVLAFETTSTLSSLRAYVQGESLWSRAQKDALHQLEAYAANGDEAHHAAFRTEIRVPMGDRQARRELEKDTPDLQIVRAGFVAGHNHPDDIDGMIDLYQRFRRTGFLARAIAIWTQGDAQIDELIAAADAMRTAYAMHDASQRDRAIAAALARARAADAKVTPLETAFSATLGAASRKAQTILQAGTLVLVLVLILVKLAFSRWMLQQHMRIEQALRTSEDRFDMAVRGSNDGIWNWAPQDNELYLSPRAIELLGHPMHDLPRQPLAFLPLVHPEDRAAVREAVDNMYFFLRSMNVEFRFLDWGGNYRWVQLRGSPVRVEAEHVLRVAGSISDIAERKRIEQLLKKATLDEQRRSEQAQIALLEQVQSSIGRELHDDLGQRLTGVAFLAKALEQRLGVSTPAEREQSAWIVNLINQSIDRVRFLSRQLSPIEIDAASLDAALQRLVDDIREIFGTRIRLRRRHGPASLPPDDANQLFRIAQESISNALRHGHATEIHVSLDTDARGQRLAISDNGTGFSVADGPARGLGLHNMRIRAHTLGARLRIRSSRRGTTVLVRRDATPAVNADIALLDARARSAQETPSIMQTMNEIAQIGTAQLKSAP